MYTEVLGREAKKSLAVLDKTDLLDNFYLAGGTGLALHYGHRISVDLDFFTQKIFEPRELATLLSAKGDFIQNGWEKGTLHGIFEGAKVSFLYYPYRLLRDLKKVGNVSIADPLDIGCMKVDAITSRGKKKDFVDLYVLLEHYHLSELVNFFEEKYADVQYNMIHIMKSLVYFDNAEEDPDVVYLGKKILWSEIKRRIENEVRKM